MHQHTILAFMLDRPGVLNKIALLMRRKMYNIDTLTVCTTEKPGISRMTITLHTLEEDRVQHIVKQIKKITEVVSAQELDPNESFWREVCLLKCTPNKSKIEYLKNNYKIEILSEKGEEIILQLAGTSKRIDAFLGEVGDDIVEIARTGVTAMER